MTHSFCYRTVLLRGIRRRCPHCGQGGLFARGLELKEHCSQCGFRLELHRGDTWGFWVLMDRLLIGVPILIFFLGYMPYGAESFYISLLVVVLLVLGTAQHRFGLCVALDYISRRRTGDAKDSFPLLVPQGEAVGTGSQDESWGERQSAHSVNPRRE